MRFKPYLRLDELAYSVPTDYRIVTSNVTGFKYSKYLLLGLNLLDSNNVFLL